MSLEDDKRSYKKQTKKEYNYCYNYRVYVNIAGNIMQLPHTREDIIGLQYAIDNANNKGFESIKLEGVDIDLQTSQKLIDLGKEINVDIYDHLWDLYAQIDATTTVDDMFLIKWSYDITQEYTT